jgi:hypothetical protein
MTAGGAVTVEGEDDRVGKVFRRIAGMVGLTVGVAGAVVGVSITPASASCDRVVTFGDAILLEGNPSGPLTKQTFTFVVTSTGCDGAGTLTYETVDDTAVVGIDYDYTIGVLTFVTGDMSDKQITVTVNRDLVIELDDRFRVYACAATGHIGGSAVGVGTIRNDDFPAEEAPSDPGVRSTAGWARRSDATVNLEPVAVPWTKQGYGCGR